MGSASSVNRKSGKVNAIYAENLSEPEYYAHISKKLWSVGLISAPESVCPSPTPTLLFKEEDTLNNDVEAFPMKIIWIWKKKKKKKPKIYTFVIMQSEQRIPTSNPNHRHLIQRQYEEMKEEKAKQMLLLKTMHSEEEAFREVTCQLSFTFHKLRLWQIHFHNNV